MGKTEILESDKKFATDHKQLFHSQIAPVHPREMFFEDFVDFLQKFVASRASFKNNKQNLNKMKVFESRKACSNIK